MEEEVIKYNPHHDSRGRFTSGGGGASGAKGGKKLSPQDNKKLDDLAIQMFNHKQDMPLAVRTGKKTPAATAYRQKFTDIVNQAAAITGTSPKEAYAELNTRMGLNPEGGTK